MRARARFTSWLAALAMGGLLIAADGAVAASKPAVAPPEKASDRERYIDLVRRKQRADRLNALYKLEAELSAKRTAYAVLDLSDRKLYFKVRGRAFKAIPLSGLEVERRSRPVDPDELAGRAYTLELKEGRGVETESIHLKSLTPDEAEKAGGRDVDEVEGAEQGEIVEGASVPEKTIGTGVAPPAEKMAGVAGGMIPPDPPPRFHMGFDGDLSIWMVADAAKTPAQRSYDRFLGVARGIGRLFVGTSAEAKETRITLRTSLDRVQQVFRQLLPSQRLLITP